jgi:hypothetical protein
VPPVDDVPPVDVPPPLPELPPGELEPASLSELQPAIVSSEKRATSGEAEKARISKKISLGAIGEQQRVATTLAHIDDIDL